MENNIISKKVQKSLTIFMVCAAVLDIIIGIFTGPNYIIMLIGFLVLVMALNVTAAMVHSRNKKNLTTQEADS